VQACRGLSIDRARQYKMRSSCFAQIGVHLRSGDASIEAALDRGTVEAECGSAEICELELELKDGDPAELFQVAQRLAKATPLALELRSKSERGYALVGGANAEAVKAKEIHIPANATSADAFKIVGWACLRQIAGNHDAVLRGDPDGIHEMRVGLRRLRAALSIFSEMLQDHESRYVHGELKWLTGELGPAREIDVFIKRVVQRLQAHRAHKDAARALCEDVLRRGGDAYRRAMDALTSARYRGLMLLVAGWIETGDWLTAEDELASARRQRSARAFATKELSQRRARIVKRGRKLLELEPHKRHKLRISAKKLRYGAEFFACLFPRAKAAKLRKSFLQALKELQDCLGALNDIVAHEELTAKIAEDAAAGKSRGQLPFIAGVASGQEESRTDSLLHKALDQHRGFARAKPFWR